MILDDLADFLTSGGLAVKGTNLFIGERTPDAPDSLLMIRQYAGSGSIYTMNQAAGSSKFDIIRFQIEARGLTYRETDNTLRSLRDVLDQFHTRDINGKTYYYIKALQPEPISIGIDESRRHTMVMNYEAMKER